MSLQREHYADRVVGARAQCRLKKGNTFTVAWIDAKHAKVGNHVELLTLDGDFWEIVSVGAHSNKDMSRRHLTFNNNI